MDDATFEELEPKLRARDDVFYQQWRGALSTLSDASATLRQASANASRCPTDA